MGIKPATQPTNHYIQCALKRVELRTYQYATLFHSQKMAHQVIVLDPHEMGVANTVVRLFTD